MAFTLLPTDWCYLYFLPVLCVVLFWVLGLSYRGCFSDSSWCSPTQKFCCVSSLHLTYHHWIDFMCLKSLFFSDHWIMGSRPGACKHCKKLKVRNYTFVIWVQSKSRSDFAGTIPWSMSRLWMDSLVFLWIRQPQHLLYSAKIKTWLWAISDDMYHASPCGAFQRWGLTDSNTRWSAISRRMTTLASDVRLVATCVSWKVVSRGQHQSEWRSVLFPDLFSSISRWIFRHLK